MRTTLMMSVDEHLVKGIRVAVGKECPTCEMMIATS